jgi:hypothetical protein
LLVAAPPPAEPGEAPDGDDTFMIPDNFEPDEDPFA